MITKTAAEIVNGAMAKAGVFNCDFLTMQTLTNELNNNYRAAYQDIAMSDSSFYARSWTFSDEDLVETVEGDPTEWHYLPDDCYIVKSVHYLASDGIGKIEIPRCPPKEYVPGTYTIENSLFHYYGQANKPISITYIPNPQTITCPAKAEELSLMPNVEDFGYMDEDSVYYHADGQSWLHSFSTNTSEAVSWFRTAADEWENGYLEFDETAQTVKYVVDGEVEADWTDSWSVGSGNPIRSFCVCDPYCMASYADGSVLVSLNGSIVPWDPKASTGHKTKGAVHALHTDDRTLMGCIYEDTKTGKYYRASFVPDTILDYPTNALFNYLEVQLACMLMSMNGVQNPYISETLMARVEKEFYDELRQNRASPVRISNQRNMRRVRGW